MTDTQPGRDAQLPSFDGGDVELIERRCLHQGFFRLDEVHLRHRRFEGGWSGRVVREVHERHAAVGVLLYDVERDSVALVEQIRAGALNDRVSPWKLEIVAGLVEEGKAPPRWRAARPWRKPAAKSTR